MASGYMMEDEADYEFYTDPDSEENVLGINTESEGKRPDRFVEGFAPTFDRPNSPASWTKIEPVML
jgi:hypothetical protein